MPSKLLTYALLLVVLFSAPCNADAACSWSDNTGTVASPYSHEDFSDCLTDASSKTGSVVIQIPDTGAGVTWDTNIAVDMKTGFANVTDLTIKGQNACTVDGNDTPTACGTIINGLSINYTGKEGKSFRLSNVETSGTHSLGYIVSVDGSSKSWRFDHLYIHDGNYTANPKRLFWITKAVNGETTYGVVDSCTIKNMVNYVAHVQPNTGGGNQEWIENLDLGTDNATYFENNKFWNDGVSEFGLYPLVVSDCNGPGMFVFRYNHFINARPGAHDAIVGGKRGVRKWEIYNNKWSITDYMGGQYIARLRSGTGVFFNNVILDPGNHLEGSDYIHFEIYRNIAPSGDPWDAACGADTGNACLGEFTQAPKGCTTDADCGGVSGACIKIDGTSDSPSGYPCRDQAGVDGNNPQTSKPFLFWNNTKNGSNIAIGVAASAATYVVSDRDYCLAEAVMPATCNGVETVYAPYTCPHPLTGLTTTCDSSVAGTAGYNIASTPTSHASGSFNLR